jgi:hypothetical protein
MLKIITKIILAILLFLCLLDMPYGYYQFVRFASMVVFVILGYYAIEEKKEVEAIIYFALAVLFQPLFKIALGRTIWNVIDVVVGCGLILSIVLSSLNLYGVKKQKN